MAAAEEETAYRAAFASLCRMVRHSVTTCDRVTSERVRSEDIVNSHAWGDFARNAAITAKCCVALLLEKELFLTEGSPAVSGAVEVVVPAGLVPDPACAVGGFEAAIRTCCAHSVHVGVAAGCWDDEFTAERCCAWGQGLDAAGPLTARLDALRAWPNATFLEIGTGDEDTLAERFLETSWTGTSVEPVSALLARVPSRPGLQKVAAAMAEQRRAACKVAAAQRQPKARVIVAARRAYAASGCLVGRPTDRHVG